jgi:hypothetical protein
LRREVFGVEHEVLKRLGVLSTISGGISREVCIVRWGFDRPKLDVRMFKDDEMLQRKPQSTFTRKEAELFRNILNGPGLEEIPE